MTVTDVLGVLWTVFVVLVLIGFAAWSIWQGNRDERELLELEADVEPTIEIHPFRILPRPPYDWQDDPDLAS